MKKILPLILLVPCIAFGANSHLNVSRARVTKAVSTRLASGEKTANKANFTLKGFVRDVSGQPLAGVSVLIKGTSTGVQTDANGRFSISTNVGEVLVFSYLGYIKKEVTVATSTELTIELDEDSRQLSEVVVTALGIKKERRSLGYSVTEVKSDVVNLAKETNFASSLEGRVAGVNVTTTSGGPASSVIINIRGAASFAGTNQPLYVINGVPMNNIDLNNVQGVQMNGGGQYANAPDQGDGIGNLNPDDIQSISVLKGGAAAALYGSRAKYGVILVTTKSGSTKGTVELTSNYEAESIVNPTDFQYVYGQGSEGKAPADAAGAYNNGNDSWGAKIDGSNVIQFDGVERPYVAQKNNISEFYRTGNTFTNTISFSKAYDQAAIRLSANDLHNNSTIPNSGYNRRSFNFSGNFSPIKGLTVDAHLNFTNDDAHNRPILGDGAGNANQQVLFLPTTINVTDLDRSTMGVKADGNEELFSNNIYATNPWFAAYKFINNSSRNRMIGSVSARYTFDDGVFIQLRLGDDYYNERYTSVVPNGAGYYAAAGQNLGETYNTVQEQNYDFLVGRAFKPTKDITITPNVGGNLRQSSIESTTEAGVGFVIPYVYTISNVASKTIAYGDYKKDVNSLYGSLELAYKSLIYIEGTARSDWFSSLASSASPNNKLNIIYPSVSGSFVFSELIKPSWMDMGKLRLGYSNVGGDADPYQTLLNYGLGGTQLNGKPLGTITNNSTPNSSLKPSDASELEIGTEIHTLNNRLNFDVAWYNKESKNEILDAPASITSGYYGAVLNIGKIRNKGWEFLVDATPVKSKKFSWNTSFNGSYNANTVLALAAGQPSFLVATARSGLATTVDVIGKASNQVQAFDYKRDGSGNIMTDPNTGVPLQGNLKLYGTANSPWVAGFNNSFTFGNLNLSFLIDGKFGGHIFSGTEYQAFEYGLTKSTLPGRETGFNGGKETAEDYYTNFGNNVSGQFVQNASFIKFRQLTLGYNFPGSMFNNVIQGATLSLVSRNLFYIMKRTTDIDPESTYGYASQGLELGSVLPSRIFGLSLDVKF